jgi:hypothetical protein
VARLGVEDLTLTVLGQPNDPTTKLTCEFVEGCPRLKKLCLQVSGWLRRDPKYYREYTRLCAEILRKNSSIEDLEMDACLPETVEMGELPSAMSNVKSLTLRELHTPTALEKWCMKGIPPSLEKLEIHFEPHSWKPHSWKQDCLVRMIHQPSSLVSLKIAPVFDTLWEDNAPDIADDAPDITDIVVSTLTCNRMLSFIFNGYCTVDFDTVLPFVGKNTALKELVLSNCQSRIPNDTLTKVLEQQNTTLEKLDAGNLDQSGTVPVAYYLALNRFGRAKLTDRSASLEDLVVVLIMAASNEALNFDLTLRHSIQYGLLLAAPSIWSGN